MWVERLDIRGYKRLSGEYEFNPRLSIICGLNEAGKSSMQEAIVRALFGFSRSERRRSEGESEQDRSQPWNSNPYALNATVKTSNGRLRIEWDLAEHEVKVRNLDTGEDLSPQMEGSRGDVLLGDRLLGLELDDFRQACCLDQGAISAVPASEDLVVAMQRAVEAGAGESGAEDAEAILVAALGDEIGVRRDNLRPTSKGRLGSLMEKKRELEGELEQAEDTQGEIAEREQEEERLREQRAMKQSEMPGIEQSLLRAREGELASRLARAHEHAQRAATDVPDADATQISSDDLAEISSRFAELERVDESLAELRPTAESARDSVRRLEEKREELRTEFDGLADYQQTDTSNETTVQGLAARRSDLAIRAEEVERSPLPTPTAPQAESSSTLLWAVAAVIVVVSAVAGIVATPLAFVGLGLASLVALLAVRRRATPTADGKVERRVAEERRQQAALDLASVDRELAATLDAAGARAMADLDQRARAYLVACENHERWLEVRGDLGEVRAQLATAREPFVDVERAERRIEELCSELRELLRDLEIETEDLAAAKREFDRRLDLERERSRQRAAAHEASEGLATALGSMTMEELEVAHATAAEQLAGHVGAHGELNPTIEPSELADRQNEVREAIRQLDVDLGRLATQISEREERLPDVPALREETDRVREEISQLEAAARAIHIARTVLDDAAREAHRAFRPRLKRALDRNLSRITDGRYTQVEIDDELNLTLVAPETGRMVPASQLSKGTQDQIFFVERLEIIDLLDPTTGEAPLLLDEPFAHFDERRLTAALQLLAEETRERQVMLFTCHDDLVQAASEACDDPVVIRLPEPG